MTRRWSRPPWRSRRWWLPRGGSTPAGWPAAAKALSRSSIVGIEPEKELPVSLVGQNVAQGRYLTADDQDVVLIGKGLATAMGVEVGDRFTLVGRATHEQMRSRTMTVVGIFDIGMPDIEKRTIYMSLAEAQDLYGLSGQITEVAISLKQIGQEPAVINALKPALPGVEFSSWQTNFPSLKRPSTPKARRWISSASSS